MISLNKRSDLGAQGEQRVCEYLTARGWFILATNYNRKFGEIDIIAQKDGTVAFIEVKTRLKKAFCSSELISISKQRKIIKVAKEFIMRHNLGDKIYRFDIALIEQEENTINYIENAFYGNEW